MTRGAKSVNDWNDEELDRQLSARHRHGEDLARQVCGLFEQLWRDHDTGITLSYELLEQSLHTSEVAFSLHEAGVVRPWQIFPKIFVSSSAALSAEMQLFYSTDDGVAVAESYASLESLVVALVHRAQVISGGLLEARPERRLFVRQSVNIPTIISTPDGALRVHAMVINRSRAGVMVELKTAAELPQSVLVQLDETQHACTVIWQDDVRAGLAFSTPPNS